jgi:hypothetical protein
MGNKVRRGLGGFGGAALAALWLSAIPSALAAPAPVDEAALFKHQLGLWQIAPQGSLTRWIEIHNLDEAKQSGVFHIEVLGQRKATTRQPLQHLKSHMAITLEALKRSVLRPLRSGSVYPESFNGAHAHWLSLPEADRQVCTRSVLECL